MHQLTYRSWVNLQSVLFFNQSQAEWTPYFLLAEFATFAQINLGDGLRGPHHANVQKSDRVVTALSSRSVSFVGQLELQKLTIACHFPFRRFFVFGQVFINSIDQHTLHRRSASLLAKISAASSSNPVKSLPVSGIESLDSGPFGVTVSTEAFVEKAL